MTTITVTISIDAGDARVTVNGGQTAASPVGGNLTGAIQGLPDELVPLPDVIPDPVPFRGAANQNPDVCPVHLVPWKTVPAGVSKKTGQPYDAFRACATQGCTQRPS